MEINMNDTVYVKLTDRGREIMRKNIEEMNNSLPEGAVKFPFKTKREDEDGWSEWQLWCLFQEFGEYVSMVKENPFDLNIRIKEDGSA